MSVSVADPKYLKQKSSWLDIKNILVDLDAQSENQDIKDTCQRL